MASNTANATTTSDPSTPTMDCPPILRGIRAALGPALLSKILSSRILLVGSGGIGCELLKNLALSGFRHVEVIDLDTIDVSNLNRQFLFRSQHVGMPKCVVATKAALEMVPALVQTDDDDKAATGKEAKYLPHHGNVCDNSRFNVPYVQTFDLVLNALDNVAARRRVNRLCLAASVPLVEAGTAGYLGQVTVIDKASGTECYECQAKPTQKVYPICTIRSTPSQPVHCIVWAKELYKLCFGPKVEDSMLFEDEESLRADAEKEEGAEDEEESPQKSQGDTNGDDKTAAASGDKEAESGDKTDTSKENDGDGAKSTYMNIVGELRSLLGVESPPQSKDELKLRAKSQEGLTALFATEIEKQIGMDRYKTADKVPIPISSADLSQCTASADGTEPPTPPTKRDKYKPTQIWSAADCISELVSCFVDASQLSSPMLPEFDKDDDIAMRFVTAASNLRSYVFQIEPVQSLYSAKGIAGNIIPAIATTNAIVAGLQILQAFHILGAQLKKDGEGKLKESCRYTYCLRDKTRRGFYLQPTTLPDPNPECFVCRNAIISLALNTKEWTLEMLLARVFKRELGFAEPTIMVGGDIIYEEGEDIDPSEYSVNISKKLSALPSGGVQHGSVVRVEDFTQDLEVEISVCHREDWTSTNDEGKVETDDREEIEKFEIGGKKPTVSEEKKADVAVEKEGASETNGSATPAAAAAAPISKTVEEDDDDEIEIVDAPEEQEAKTECSKAPENVVGETSNKRSLENGGERSTKKAKIDESNQDNDLEVIEIE